MPDSSFPQRVEALVRDFICRLDRREYDAWMNNFAADGYYAVLRSIELLDGDNVLLVGEDMKRLSAQIQSGTSAICAARFTALAGS